MNFKFTHLHRVLNNIFAKTRQIKVFGAFVGESELVFYRIRKYQFLYKSVNVVW